MTYTITLQAKPEDADTLLLELAEDPRVVAITMKVGDGKYRLAVPAPDLPGGRQ